MKKNKRNIALMVVFIFIFSLFPVQAVRANEDISIISSTEITLKQAKDWARRRGATETFINLADLFWKYAPSHGGVNPAIAYVQSAKETGYGKFTGVLNESYHNTCGLKISSGGDDSDKDAHYRFESWDDGVQAHLDHLALYSGAEGYPRTGNTKDPRHFKDLKGRAKTVKALGGKWAPSVSYGEEIFNMYNSILVDIENSEMRGALDNPLSSQKVNGNLLEVRGWALNPNGIKSVEVYVDGVLKGNAQLGISRPDVASAYPGYKNSGESGYLFKLDLSKDVSGSKVIKVRQVGNDGRILEFEREILLKNGKYEPLGRIDDPSEGDKVGSTFKVRGWAIADSGVKEVKLYVDGKYKGSTVPNKQRTDIKSAFPEYPNAESSGYEFNISLNDIAAGKHLITVEQISNDGTSKTFERNIVLSKLESLGRIDEPSEGGNVRDKVTIRGWAIADSGVKEVKLYVDGKYKGSTVPNKQRPDIKNAFPEYPSAESSGYEMEIDIEDIGAGDKTIVAEQVSNDGTIKNIYRTVRITKLDSLGRIDSPSEGSKVGNTINVVGWAIADSGVKEVKLYVDGKYKGSTVPNKQRPDIKNAFPEYPNAESSGYEIEVNIEDIGTGYKTIVAEHIENDGTIKRVERVIQVTRLESEGRIDSPSEGSVVTNKINIRGWAIANSGVKEVRLYVDGILLGTTEPNKLRPDIKNAFPDYPNAETSGYELEVSLKDIPLGVKTIIAEQIENDGKVKKVERSIEVAGLDPVGRIDEPYEDEETPKRLMVRGWAIADRGVKEVNIYVDGKYKGTAIPNIPRPDIAKAFPDYVDSATSGYEIEIDLEDIAPGKKTIVVEEVGNDGVKNIRERNFNLVKKPSKYAIDSPFSGEIIVEDTMKVRGWALADSGVKQVKVYLDGAFKASANINLFRPDVKAAFPDYINSENSGYEANISIENLKPGKHNVSIEVIAKDGSVTTGSRSFYYKNKGLLVVLDAGHGGSDPGAIRTHSGTTYQEKKLNLEISLRIKKDLDEKGYVVILTRAQDEFVELKDRSKMANNLKADVFVSIHQNTVNQSNVSGTEVFYNGNFKPDYEFPPHQSEKDYYSSSLAKATVNKISESTGIKNRGAKNYSNLSVLRNTSMPAILVECGFISNPDEASKLSQSLTQQAISNSIVESIGEVF